MSGDLPFYPAPLPEPARLPVERIVQSKATDGGNLPVFEVRLDSHAGQLLGRFYPHSPRLDPQPARFVPSFRQPRLHEVHAPPDCAPEAEWPTVRRSIAAMLPLLDGERQG